MKTFNLNIPAKTRKPVTKKKAKRGSKGVELAVNRIKDNHALDMKYRGPENFTDLADYADKHEAKIDSYQEQRMLQGPGPMNIGNYFSILNSV